MRYCQQCDYETLKQSTLSMHISMKHSTKRSHKCRDCEQTFSAKTQLNHHRMNRHSRNQSKCLHPDCKHIFKNPTTHKVHYVRRHMNVKSLFTVQEDKTTIQCNICDDSFMKDAIYYHLAMCSSDSPFSQNYGGPALQQQMFMRMEDDDSESDAEAETADTEEVEEYASLDFDDLESIDGDMEVVLCREVRQSNPIAEIEIEDDNEFEDLLNNIIDFENLSQ